MFAARMLGALIPAALALAGCAPVAPSSGERPVSEGKAPSAAELLSGVGLSFIENRGQADPRVSHYLPGRDTSVYFTPEGLRLSLRDTKGTSQRLGLGLDFVNARSVRPSGESPGSASVSYFKGPASQWKTGLRTFGSIVYRDLWPGIDLAYSGTGSKLKYEFRVRPGADPGDISLAWRGAKDLRVNGSGQLEVATATGTLTDDAPLTYQLRDGERVRVDSAYVVNGERYGFRLGAYDPTRPLIIDPALIVYSGFIGGSALEETARVAVDGAGNAYVAGDTQSTEATFPETAGFDATANGDRDAFVAKVNPAGTALVYAGFIGGSTYDSATGIAVDAAGAAYISGTTDSEASFPAIVGPDITPTATQDGFVAKVNPAGTALVYAGFVGGDGDEHASSIAVDAAGAAYVVGGTNSSAASMPVTGGPELAPSGGVDALVGKVVPSGASFEYLGYLGGTGEDRAADIAVDGAGSAYVTGQTDSPSGFPMVVGPDITWNQMDDGFVAKISPSGAAVAYAGYLGGAGPDQGVGIAVDAAGNAYVTGLTRSPEASFPEAVGPDLSFNGEADAFVAKVNPAGTTFQYAGYIGGSGVDWGVDIATDGAGNAYVVGFTTSNEADFPEAVGPDLTFGGFADAFVAKVEPDGKGLEFAGFLGGTAEDVGIGIALDGSSNLYVSGRTFSTEVTFPVLGGPDVTHNGDGDAFITKITQNVCLGAAATIVGTAGNDTINGTAGADVILALGGNDTVNGLGGNDIVCAGDGDDTLVGGDGDDKLDGEEGTDTASFAGTAGVVADLVAGTSTGAGADTLANVENLTGSSKKDTLRGSTAGNVIRGGGGSDRLAGRAGADRLLGQKGKDRLSGGGANDRLAGGKGNDRMNGGKGKKDRCNGGKGGADTATNCEKVSGVP